MRPVLFCSGNCVADNCGQACLRVLCGNGGYGNMCAGSCYVWGACNYHCVEACQPSAGCAQYCYASCDGQCKGICFAGGCATLTSCTGRFLFFLRRINTMDYNQTILKLSEMSTLIIVMNDIKWHYSKKYKSFYTKSDMCITISFERIMPFVKAHVRRNGISSVYVDRFFKRIKNIYHLLGALRKDMHLSITLEAIDNYTVILGYNEYKRGKIRFMRFEPIKGEMYNTQKYIDLYNSIRLKAKAIKESYGIDPETLKKEFENYEGQIYPYSGA